MLKWTDSYFLLLLSDPCQSDWSDGWHWAMAWHGGCEWNVLKPLRMGIEREI